MITRSNQPIPDPAESVSLSTRRVFKDGVRQVVITGGQTYYCPWLPDIRAVKDSAEVDPRDQLDWQKFPKYPDEAPPRPVPDPTEVGRASAEIAEWIFRTYSNLVAERLKFYNRWRLQFINDASPSPQLQGFYRFAAARATEQMIRRDYVFVTDPASPQAQIYFQPVLPVFEITMDLTIDDQNDTVKGMILSASVEVRQKVYLTQMKAKVDIKAQDNWSSSSLSSSSSSSSFFPY